MYLNQYKQNKNDSINNNNGDNSKNNKNDDGNIIIIIMIIIKSLFQPGDFSGGSTTDMGTITFFITVNKFFIHHCRSRAASFVNLMCLCQKCLLLFSVFPNLFPGKVDVKVPIRLDNFLIVKLSLFKKPLQDSIFFSLFSLVIVTITSFEMKENLRYIISCEGCEELFSECIIKLSVRNNLIILILPIIHFL